MDALRGFLARAGQNGEVIRIVYHGGSQPGTVREVTPLFVGEDWMRARDFASHRTKVFKLEKVQLANEADNLPEYQPPMAVAAAEILPLPWIICGLGIRHVRRHIGGILAAEFDSLTSLMRATEAELASIHGIGPRIAASIAEFFRRPENRRRVEMLVEEGVTPGGGHGDLRIR